VPGRPGTFPIHPGLFLAPSGQYQIWGVYFKPDFGPLWVSHDDENPAFSAAFSLISKEAGRVLVTARPFESPMSPDDPDTSGVQKFCSERVGCRTNFMEALHYPKLAQPPVARLTTSPAPSSGRPCGRGFSFFRQERTVLPLPKPARLSHGLVTRNLQFRLSSGCENVNRRTSQVDQHLRRGIFSL
jgi:hypothetical protein